MESDDTHVECMVLCVCSDCCLYAVNMLGVHFFVCCFCICLGCLCQVAQLKDGDVALYAWLMFVCVLGGTSGWASLYRFLHTLQVFCNGGECVQRLSLSLFLSSSLSLSPLSLHPFLAPSRPLSPKQKHSILYHLCDPKLPFWLCNSSQSTNMIPLTM